MKPISLSNNKRLYQIAFALAVFTIIYNIAEGLIASDLGYEDESLALFGFGTDSFIEVVSGLGIAHMVLRIQRRPDSNKDDFEWTALRITGFAFYALVCGLIVTSIYNICTGHDPTTTFWGVVISVISLFSDVDFGRLEKKNRKGIKLGSHFSGSQLHLSLRLHVANSTGQQQNL